MGGKWAEGGNGAPAEAAQGDKGLLVKGGTIDHCLKNAHFSPLNTVGAQSHQLSCWTSRHYMWTTTLGLENWVLKCAQRDSSSSRDGGICASCPIWGPSARAEMSLNPSSFCCQCQNETSAWSTSMSEASYELLITAAV